MSINVKVNGNWNAMDKGFVKIDGVWREIGKTLTKIDGVWREGYSQITAPLYTELPVFLEYTSLAYSSSTQLDTKYRSLAITAKNAYKFVVSGGDYNPNATMYAQQSEFGNEYRIMNYDYYATNTHFDVTKTNGDATIQVYNSSNQLIHTLQWKARSNYNYIIVDNSYVSLERIKSNQTTVTVPTAIEGLPVLDAGAIFHRIDTVIDSYTVQHVIIPSEIIYGGSICHDGLLVSPQKVLKSVTINNPNFTFTAYNKLYQETNGYTIKVPANSKVYNDVISIGYLNATIQTF